MPASLEPQAPHDRALWRLSASQIAALVSSRQVSAHEVALAHLSRLDAVNPLLNAIVECRPDEVLARAHAVDAAIAQGQAVGPLAGVPVTIKVNVDQQGYATTNGITLQKDLIAGSNSPIVDHFLQAGAVPLGRTNTPAFSYRWFTNNRLHGATYNPRNHRLTPGGSSGGAAAAVAAGMGAIAHGTDIAGSIRYPAYACGVHGLRPSLGRVAAFNATASKDRSIGGQLMAVSGPLARTTDDLRLALCAMARADARDPWWVPAPLVGPERARTATVCLRPDGMDTDPILCEQLLQAAQKLRDAGWLVEEVDALPPLQEAVALQVTLWMGDHYADQVAAAQAEGDEGALAALAGQKDFVQSLGPQDSGEALVQRLRIAREWQLFLERTSVVLLPCSAQLPFEDQLDLRSPQDYQRVWTAQMPMIALPLTGLPCLNLCTGFTSDDTPLGIQVLAGRFREDLCLAAAQAIEARSPALPIAML